MSQNKEKKFRKQLRKSTDKLSHGLMGKAAFKIARQRDYIFLAAIIEFVVIVVLGLVILL